jgi:hypothetical protein
MSKGSRKKRATRPWQDARAMRDVSDLLVPSGGGVDVDDELRLDGYEVKTVESWRAEKDYVCPGCGNTVSAGENHLVVWPDDESDLRRHWHRHCWRVEVRRSSDDG